MLRTIYMSDYKYRYIPREKLIGDAKPLDHDQDSKIKQEFKFHENGDTFYQDMLWKDTNLTTYHLDYCRIKSQMRTYPDGKVDEIKRDRPVIYCRKRTLKPACVKNKEDNR